VACGYGSCATHASILSVFYEKCENVSPVSKFELRITLANLGKVWNLGLEGA
jgi:hypothetical protein